MSNDSSAADSQLADWLLANSDAIVAKSLGYMPRDAFWALRYAERAKRFANEDGAFHVRYLADAVRAHSQTVMSEYAKWLRDLLVPRGMCTLHLGEHLEYLARALESESDAAPSIAYLRGAIEALNYGDSTAGAIQSRARDCEQAQPGPRPPRFEEPRNSAWETQYLCHYVADALHRSDPALLRAHVEWARQSFAAHGGSDGDFTRWLESIDAALAPAGAPRDFLACPSAS